MRQILDFLSLLHVLYVFHFQLRHNLTWHYYCGWQISGLHAEWSGTKRRGQGRHSLNKMCNCAG